MAVTYSVKLSGRFRTTGAVSFLRAELEDKGGPLATVYYAVAGRKQKAGLRLDLSKQAFLDKTGDPEVDAQLQHAVHQVVTAINKYSKPQEVQHSADVTLARKRIANAAATNALQLDLSELSLERIPPEIGQLTALTKLNLSQNKLSSLPPEIGRLTALRELYLGDNKLSTLPPEIGQLTALRTLDLYSNQLSTLPPEIGQLTALRTLDLYSNQLSTLPPEIGQLTALTALGLADNQLFFLPPEIGRLTALTALFLDNNPLPATLLRLHGKELIAYVRSLAPGTPIAGKTVREADGTRPFNEAKLLLLGPGEVGKTWLLRAIQGKIPKPSGSTKGIEIAREPLDVPHPADPARTIHFNCWDFGGQEQYQITHQIFFSPRAVYLLVWKPRPGVDSDVEARLERIRISAGKTAKVFVVSTHADHNIPAHIGQKAILERFGDLVAGFYAVDSAKGPKGTGIAELKAAIAKAAVQLEGMETPFGGPWHRARDSARALGRPTIRFSEFAKLCDGHGMDRHAASALAAVMHVQGNAVYFADVPADTVAADENLVVLNPEWLAKAVTFVLEDKKIREDSGILDHGRLKQIWKADPKRDCPGYAVKLHGYLLWLMWKFDIAYPQDDRTSLVPELIQRNRPDDLRWTPDRPGEKRQATMILRVSGQDPPPGLIPALTAAVHPLRRVKGPAADGDRLDRNWRSGFFLDTALRGEAFVELIDRDLIMTVRDGYPSDLIRQIRATLQRLGDARWPQLPAEYHVPCIGKIGDKACRGTFRLEYLENRRGQRVSCQECGDDALEVDQMLDGLDANAEAMLEMVRQIREGRTDLMAVALRLYRDALDSDRAEIERGPCMFTIFPTEATGWRALSNLTTHHLNVTCWCEHPDGPHPAATMGSGEPPDYVLNMPRAWLVKAAPYISWAATLLKAMVPVAGSVVKTGLGSVLDQTMKDRIDLMCEVTSALPDGKLEIGNELELEAMHRSRPEIVALRHIHDALLEQVPKARQWGNLRLVLTKSNQLLWLCPTHAAIQDPPVPKVGA